MGLTRSEFNLLLKTVLVMMYEQITQGTQSFVQSGLENLWGCKTWTLVESHEVPMVPLLELGRVFMDDMPSLRCVSCTTLLGVMCKFIGGALSPSVCVIDEDIKRYWSLNRPLRDSTPPWSSSGHGAVDCCPHAMAGWLSQVSFFVLFTQHQLSWKRDQVKILY